MNFLEAAGRDAPLIQQLFALWQKSVRVTHLFLSDSELIKISECIPRALAEVPHLIVAFNEETKLPAAFMGIEDKKLQMLFVSPEEIGKGLGKELILHGIEHYSLNEVGVNEQNPGARGFYEHMGFRFYRRADRDEQGKPYPILYMRLKNPGS